MSDRPTTMVYSDGAYTARVYEADADGRYAWTITHDPSGEVVLERAAKSKSYAENTAAERVWHFNREGHAG